MSRADVIAGVLAEHGWDDVDAERILGAAQEAIAWDLLDQTGDLADRGPSKEALWDARRTAAAVLAAAEPAAEQARAGALTEAEAALDRVRALDTGYSGGGNKHAYCIDPGALRAALAGNAEHERSGT